MAEDETVLKSLRKILKTDEVFMKRYRRVLDMKMQDEKWYEEIESLHLSRGMRTLKSGELLQSSQKVGIDNNLENQYVRSRCVEIKVRALRQVVGFEEASDSLKKYVMHRYAKRLGRFKTVTERKAEVDYALMEVDKLIKRLNFIVKICDIIIADVDAAGYTLHRVGELLEQKRKDR